MKMLKICGINSDVYMNFKNIYDYCKCFSKDFKPDTYVNCENCYTNKTFKEILEYIPKEKRKIFLYELLKGNNF